MKTLVCKMKIIKVLCIVFTGVFVLMNFSGCESQKNDAGNYTIAVFNNAPKDSTYNQGVPDVYNDISRHLAMKASTPPDIVKKDGSLTFRGEDYFYNEIKVYDSTTNEGDETRIEASSSDGKTISVSYSDGQDSALYAFKDSCCGLLYTDFVPKKTDGETDEDFKNRCTEDMQALLDEFDLDYDLSEYEIITEDSIFKFKWAIRKGPVIIQEIRPQYCRQCGKLCAFYIDGAVNIDDIYDSVPNYTEEQYVELVNTVVKQCYEECYSSVEISKTRIGEFENSVCNIRYNEELDRYVMAFVPTSVIEFDESKTATLSNVGVALIFEPTTDVSLIVAISAAVAVIILFVFVILFKRKKRKLLNASDAVAEPQTHE